MRSKIRISFAMVAGLLAIYTLAFAHHGASVSYNVEKPIVLKGTVTKFSWSNPHCEIYFDVADDHGKIVRWGSETNAPGTLTKVGWTRNSLKPGDQITITVFPSTLGRPFGLVSKIVLANGQKLIPVFAEDAVRRRETPG